ncbi:protein tilB [Coccinella septempunctata]|uniref:protein tilB n=1 Tax=Coccinella septempunctata TaxID=41139 RepID=UPI001D068576|nr:protein tilB [Coccinella septempunctata]
MVRITEELVRKRSEHNEGLIGTLEELSLHQEDIEKIEHLNNWCRDLQILYLQANIISKIENLNKLKKLQYLNLAINNIERIENLERCESLEKLDLTLNFIGDLESVCTLQNNHLLRSLNLTGNPCAEYEGYREYVVAKLPQIERLDSRDISRSERIKAQQNLPNIEGKIRKEQLKYGRFREEQKLRLSQSTSSELDDEQYWKSSSEHAPETRVEMAQRSRRARKQDETVQKMKQEVRLFSKDGRPLNVNQAKIPFTFSDENPQEYQLTIHVYKYLDTELINVDLQPIYARISIKEKIFQIVFPDEILTDRSTCRRSTTTGHLVLRMPRANYKPRPSSLLLENINEEDKREHTEEQHGDRKKQTREYLEVEGVDSSMDFSKIVEKGEELASMISEVPPLEYGY